MDRDELNVNNELNEEKIEEIVVDGIVTEENLPEPEVTEPVNDLQPEPVVPPVYTPKAADPALKNKNIFALISMIAGIASLIFSCCCFLSIPCGIAAIVFGILGYKSERRAMAIAGIVIGAISIVITLVVTISIIVSLILENGAVYYPSYSSHYSW